MVVDLDTGRLVAGMTGLSFQLEVTSDSIEIQPDDNRQLINIKLVTQVTSVFLTHVLNEGRWVGS